VVLVAVLSLVALVGGCLGRSGPALQLARQQPLTGTARASAPRPPRIVASGASSGRWLVYTSAPLTAAPPLALCGRDKVTWVAATQLAVSEGATACHARLHLTASGGQQATVAVTIPARSKAKAKARPVSVAKLYCFANPAGRAIYITIDDGWTPSDEVLALMHQTYLPITAFVIADAIQEHLSYWTAFVAAGGMLGDHTVSHPFLTKITQAKATAQWAQARTALGRWLGQTPVIGRPPYGAFNRKVEVAAARGGLAALAGWSATVSGNRIRTWNGKPLVPGEIVLLHWVPGLGHQLTVLLAAIRALHLNPAPLTLASFAGIAPQQHSLSGD
jgi:peptidoglycan/xylan/chitin deacetylase (PgdA/CDA1 family)